MYSTYNFYNPKNPKPEPETQPETRNPKFTDPRAVGEPDTR